MKAFIAFVFIVSKYILLHSRKRKNFILFFKNIVNQTHETQTQTSDIYLVANIILDICKYKCKKNNVLTNRILSNSLVRRIME